MWQDRLRRRDRSWCDWLALQFLSLGGIGGFCGLNEEHHKPFILPVEHQIVIGELLLSIEGILPEVEPNLVDFPLLHLCLQDQFSDIIHSLRHVKEEAGGGVLVSDISRERISDIDVKILRGHHVLKGRQFLILLVLHPHDVHYILAIVLNQRQPDGVEFDLAQPLTLDHCYPSRSVALRPQLLHPQRSQQYRQHIVDIRFKCHPLDSSEVIHHPILQLKVHGAVEGEAVVDTDLRVGIDAVLIGQFSLLFPMNLLHLLRQVYLHPALTFLHTCPLLQVAEAFLAIHHCLCTLVPGLVDGEIAHVVGSGVRDAVADQDAEDDQYDHQYFLQLHQIRLPPTSLRLHQYRRRIHALGNSLLGFLGLGQDFFVGVGVVSRLFEVQILAEGFKLLNGHLFETVILEQLILEVIQPRLLLLDERLPTRTTDFPAFLLGVTICGGVRHSKMGQLCND